jgi:hypothetical protein
MHTELIIGSTLFRVFQGLIGLSDLFKFGLGARLFGHIGMIFMRQLPVGFYVGTESRRALVQGWRNSPEFHGLSSMASPRAPKHEAMSDAPMTIW